MIDADFVKWVSRNCDIMGWLFVQLVKQKSLWLLKKMRVANSNACMVTNFITFNNDGDQKV